LQIGNANAQGALRSAMGKAMQPLSDYSQLLADLLQMGVTIVSNGQYEIIQCLPLSNNSVIYLTSESLGCLLLGKALTFGFPKDDENALAAAVTNHSDANGINWLKVREGVAGGYTAQQCEAHWAAMSRKKEEEEKEGGEKGGQDGGAHTSEHAVALFSDEALHLKRAVEVLLAISPSYLVSLNLEAPQIGSEPTTVKQMGISVGMHAHGLHAMASLCLRGGASWLRADGGRNGQLCRKEFGAAVQVAALLRHEGKPLNQNSWDMCIRAIAPPAPQVLQRGNRITDEAEEY